MIAITSTVFLLIVGLLAIDAFHISDLARLKKWNVAHTGHGPSHSNNIYRVEGFISMSRKLQEDKNNIKSAPPKIIIAGAPAAGKGTQCEVIKSSFGVIHLSTGDILRAAVKEGTDLGKKAKAFMDAGQLVPDELIIGVVCDRLRQQDCITNGWLLDGFPRTRAQAEALAQAGLVPDNFILLDVPEALLVERVTGRRTDPVTGKIYHLKYSPPESEEIAARLIQRSDDTAEKIIVRYREFQSHIDAIKSFYDSKTIRVDGSMDKESVSRTIISALEEGMAAYLA